ncbi:hypothetical protein Hanom_Chr12g01178531 [Helianthus anomalus]
MYKIIFFVSVSQVEYEVLNLLDPEHAQITVLMHFELSFYPCKNVEIMCCTSSRSLPNPAWVFTCCMAPSFARVITQTLFQVSMFDFVPFSHHHFLFAIITDRGQKHKG